MVTPTSVAVRARSLHAQLLKIAAAAMPQIEGIYTIEALAVEGWLRHAVATAEQLAAELERVAGGDFDPGGEHGGPAD